MKSASFHPPGPVFEHASVYVLIMCLQERERGEGEGWEGPREGGREGEREGEIYIRAI